MPPATARSARSAPEDVLAELGLPADLVTGEAVVLELRPASCGSPCSSGWGWA